jgi:hypothetical protein
MNHMPIFGPLCLILCRMEIVLFNIYLAQHTKTEQFHRRRVEVREGGWLCTTRRHTEFVTAACTVLAENS